MNQFGWLSEIGGNFLNLFQKEGLPRKGGGSLRKGGGSNPGGNYEYIPKLTNIFMTVKIYLIMKNNVNIFTIHESLL